MGNFLKKVEDGGLKMEDGRMFLAQTDSGYGYYPIGIFGAVSGLVILFIGIVWVIFPFLVNVRLNQVIAELRGLRADLKGKKEGNVQRPTLNVQRPTEEKTPRQSEAATGANPPPREATAGREVYRID